MKKGFANFKRTKKYSKNIRTNCFLSINYCKLHTLSYHLSDHFIENLCTAGSNEHLHASLQEGSHENFKRVHRKTSRRHNSALRKALSKQQQISTDTDKRKDKYQDNNPKVIGNQKEFSITPDTPCLIGSRL